MIEHIHSHRNLIGFDRNGIPTVTLKASTRSTAPSRRGNFPESTHTMRTRTAVMPGMYTVRRRAPMTMPLFRTI